MPSTEHRRNRKPGQRCLELTWSGTVHNNLQAGSLPQRAQIPRTVQHPVNGVGGQKPHFGLQQLYTGCIGVGAIQKTCSGCTTVGLELHLCSRCTVVKQQ